MTHSVELKLHSILTRVCASESLPTKLLYKVQWFYAYTQEVVVALISLGFAAPLLAGMAGEDSGVAKSLAAAEPIAGTVSLALLVVWVGVGVYLKRKDAADRAAVAESIAKQMQVIENGLDTVANTADPLPKLNEIHEQIIALVDLAIMKDAWHERRSSLSTFEKLAKEHVDALANKYRHLWGEDTVIQQAVPAHIDSTGGGRG